MNHITIGSDRIPRLGYGCMGLTQAYHPVDLDKARALLQRIADEGPVMLDTAATYSGGKNEILVGSVLKTSRSKVFLASTGSSGAVRRACPGWERKYSICFICTE
jgi:aryl-alcohol dehydrogenase-like predicted oxidoreductase